MCPTQVECFVDISLRPKKTHVWHLRISVRESKFKSRTTKNDPRCVLDICNMFRGATAAWKLGWMTLRYIRYIVLRETGKGTSEARKKKQLLLHEKQNKNETTRVLCCASAHQLRSNLLAVYARATGAT